MVMYSLNVHATARPNRMYSPVLRERLHSNAPGKALAPTPKIVESTRPLLHLLDCGYSIKTTGGRGNSQGGGDMQNKV